MLLETARLIAVQSYDVLGRSVAGLDLLAGYAAARFGQEFAGVSFVGESAVWFAGAAGVPAREMARAGSFCAEVVRTAAPLVVGDAGDDPRFRDHELVQGAAGARAYAGAPLCDEDGYTLGAVCILGREPGSVDPARAGELELMAQVARRFLALQRSDPGPEPARVQGWLGVRTVGWRQGGVGVRSGLSVLSVAAGSPAEQAGLRPTDVLYAIDAHILSRPADIVAALAGRERGELARIRFQRAGSWHDRLMPIEPQPKRAGPAWRRLTERRPDRRC